MLDNMFAETFDKAGTYTEDVDSSAVISADNVTLQGLTIAGDLIVAEGVADGHVVLDGVTVEGKLIVRGGGTNSVVIKGDSKVDVVTVAKGAVVSDLTVSGSDAALAVAGKVEQVSVTKEADGVSIQTEKGSKIDSVVTSGSNTTVAGSGTVTKVEATPNASGTTVSTSGTQVENNSGDSVTIPGGSVDAGQSGSTSGGSNGDGDGDGDTAGEQEQAMKDLVKNAQSYNGYEDQPDGIWVYQGNFITAESGDVMTISGAYTLTQVADGTAMNDMARFLGALYWQDNGATVASSPTAMRSTPGPTARTPPTWAPTG